MHSKHPLYRHKYLRQPTIETMIKDETEIARRIAQETSPVKTYYLSAEELDKYQQKKTR